MIIKNNRKIVSIPPIYFFFCIAVSIVLYFVSPQMNLIKFPYNIITGIPSVLLGFYMISSPHFLLKKNNTPEKFQKSVCVVKEGLYKYSRNPMYSGFVIFLIGLSCASGNLISFISPIFFFSIINWMFIPYEEEKMENELGQEYIEYKNQVRRWI